jgi:hypothetical protein
LRVDGFVSVHGPLGGGELVTRPILFAGNRLTINFATSAAGSIRVQLEDREGRPTPGFTLADCNDQFGDELRRIVSWKMGADVGGQAGKPARLRFELRDADLFSVHFTEA